ncbi:MAG: hypothetical protein KA794_02525 [Candidatus Obscuribacter sp.]|nr:hypothetical protein [Candidatus Obscuribacter sp.]MBP7575550.1 hypothetical protein [Candidatus Obscuribacter sp.]
MQDLVLLVEILLAHFVAVKPTFDLPGCDVAVAQTKVTTVVGKSRIISGVMICKCFDGTIIGAIKNVRFTDLRI